MASKATVAKQLKNTSSAYLTKDARSDLTARLARIEGHVRAVRQMLEEDESCEDLMVQLAAVRAAPAAGRRLRLPDAGSRCRFRRRNGSSAKST